MLQPVLWQHAASLRSLSLVGSSIASVMAGVSLPRLTTLDLTGCRALMEIAISAPTLQHLTLSRTAVGALELSRLPLSSLKSLELESCRNLHSFPQQPNSSEVTPLPVLELLNVSNTPLTDANLRAVVSACTTLRTLHCRSSRVLKTPQITSNSLRVLSLSRCRELTGPILNCGQLLELDVSKTCLQDRTNPHHNPKHYCSWAILQLHGTARADLMCI